VTTLLPAWHLLEPQSVKALLEPPAGVPKALALMPARIAPAVALQAPMIVAARLLLERVQEGAGLILTKAGFLKRADVWEVFDRTEWPGLSKAHTLAMNKVLNEQDAFGVLFTRIVLQSAGLLRKRGGVLRASKVGKSLLEPEAAPALLSLLFESAFWKTNLQDFDRNPLEFWPQHHMGLVLWSLSVAAHDWSRASTLVESCTLMETIGDPIAPDYPEFALITRALRPLTWLGLLEVREAGTRSNDDVQEYRKTPLFDQLLSFDVRLREAEGPLQ
jgi:hypothetical protein